MIRCVSRSRLWSVLVFALGVIGAPSRPEAQPIDPVVDACVDDAPVYGAWMSPIDIYLNNDLADNLVHVDGRTWTSSELAWAVESTIESFGENAAAGQPALRFAGFTSAAWNAQLGPNTIHLAPNLDLQRACADYGTAYAVGSQTNGAWIIFKRSGTGIEDGKDLGLEDCAKKWEQYVSSGAPATPDHILRSAINHEMLHHFMGANHYGDCGYSGQCASALCACVDGIETAAERWSCYRFDWEAMRVHYGRFGNDQYEHDESLDGLNWFSATPGTGGALEFAPLPGVSNNIDLSYMFAAVRRPYKLYGRIWRWVYTTQVWEYWGYLGNTSEALLGTVDVAYGGSPSYPHFAWLKRETFTEVDKAIVVTRFTAPNQRTHYQWGTDVTWAQGVSITYDPKNDFYFLIWRDNDLFIQVQTFKNGVFSGAMTLMDGNDPIRAAEAPNITCGPATLDKNCLLVWASVPEGSEEYQSLRWVQFDVFVFWGWYFWDWGPHMNQGYPQYGAPSVTYQGPTSSDEAYLVSWNVPWGTVYTMGKDTNASSFWDGTTIRSHTVPGRALSPAIGGGSGVNELITVWK